MDYIKFLQQAEKRRGRIVALYTKGLTTVEIAIKYGITRARVQQVLAEHGVSRESGGQHLKALIRRKKVEEKRDALYIKKVGCDWDTYKKIRDLGKGNDSPVVKYSSQRRKARERGILWKLKFFEWWNIWQESGKWDTRGKHTGKYVMARIGDVGPYSADNVKIITCNENIKERNPNRRARRVQQIVGEKVK